MKINGFGMFMLLVYPGAFVDMHSESLFSVSAWRQLRIFCAGIWHNLIIVLTGIIMFLSLPTLLLPLYSVHEQLVVVSHTEVSPSLSVHIMRFFVEFDSAVRLKATSEI